MTRFSTRNVVAGSAILAFLLRFPGAIWPVRPDEGGLILVARHWDPQPDSVYGTYFVDRPPPLVAVFKVSDWIGGPHFIRAVAAFGCALLVVAAARAAYLVAGEQAARWTAVATAALTANAMIDSVAAKGEVLGIPFVMASFWLALEGLALLERSPRRAGWCAFGAGAAAVLAIGMKQNLVTGLAFGGVLLLASWWHRDITAAQFRRLTAAALGGAALPLLLLVGWCLAAGVHLEELWYAVYGFRGDALDVIDSGARDAPALRALILVGVLLATGMGLVIAAFLLGVRRSARPAVAITAVAVLAVDVLGVVLGGSYWRSYLLGVIPTVAVCAALLVAEPGRPGQLMRRCLVFVGISGLLSPLGWLIGHVTVVEPPTELYTGEAIAVASEPGDSIVVFGGRADVVMASGLPTPYEHLWSLPMRTLDPDGAQLATLLRSDRAPTWLVGWVDFDAWNGTGLPVLEAAVDERYQRHGTACDDHPIWLRRGVDRPVPEIDCANPWP